MSVLNIRKIKPFLIKRKIRKVTFELNLFNYLKIYLVISCIYLELALSEYLKGRAPLLLITIEGEERYFINYIRYKE
jgi:hypothetical protein